MWCSGQSDLFYIFTKKKKVIPIPETLRPELIFCEPETVLLLLLLLLQMDCYCTVPLTFVSLIRCSGQFDPHTDRHIHRHTNRHIRCETYVAFCLIPILLYSHIQTLTLTLPILSLVHTSPPS